MRADELRYAALAVRAAFTEGYESGEFAAGGDRPTDQSVAWARSESKKVYDILLKRAGKSPTVSVET